MEKINSDNHFEVEELENQDGEEEEMEEVPA